MKLITCGMKLTLTMIVLVSLICFFMVPTASAPNVQKFLRIKITETDAGTILEDVYYYR